MAKFNYFSSKDLSMIGLEVLEEPHAIFLFSDYCEHLGKKARSFNKKGFTRSHKVLNNVLGSNGTQYYKPCV